MPLRRFLVGLLPGAAILAVVTGVYLWVPASRLDWFVETYGVVAYLGGFVLAWIFHRSRAFIVLGLVAWLDLFIVGAEAHPALTVPLGSTVLALLGVLSLTRDRGVVSQVGILQLLAACGIAAAAGFLATDPERMAALAADPQVPPLIAPTWPGFPRLTVVVAAFTILALLYALQRYRGPVERGLIWTALLVLVAMHESIPVDRASIFLMAAGLAMTVAVVETSYVMAYRDELTGLPARRALMQYLDEIQGTYTIAMVDVDHFKKFNDKHGHDVGDQVLKLVASRLARAPGGAKAYRYGGEEFTLLLPGRVVDEALPHLEQVREAVQEAKFTLRSWRRPKEKPTEAKSKKSARQARKLSVTVSIGVADSSGGGEPEAVLKEADEALYRAKKKGRNRVAR